MEFIEQTYPAAFNNNIYQTQFARKRIVIVMDNAIPHNGVKESVDAAQQQDHMEMLTILRVGPYSPMLNPIGGCFSIVKSRVRAKL